MISLRTLVKSATAAAALAGSAMSASAADQLTYSVTAGATTNYVFRGITQSLNDPAFQAAVDVSYGIFYAGVWGSKIDFGSAQGLGPKANAEVDLYAGIRPVWKAPWGSDVTFDLGAIYYWYPGAADWGNSVAAGCTLTLTCQVDYVELKAGYSMPSIFLKNLTTGTTLYWSPDYTLESGSVLTVESSASYVLPNIGIFAPTLSGAYGTVYGNASDGFQPGGTVAEDTYMYWNVGLTLAVEKMSFDFRYWDSDIDVVNIGNGACTRPEYCDSKFVFSAKVTLP